MNDLDGSKQKLLRLAQRVADGDPLEESIEPEHGDDSLPVKNLKWLQSPESFFSAQECDAPVPMGPGSRLSSWGHLQIKGIIGEGSYGVVYRAHDPILKRDVALKLRSSGAWTLDDSEYIEEARRMARVRHPNVLAVHGVREKRRD